MFLDEEKRREEFYRSRGVLKKKKKGAVYLCSYQIKKRLIFQAVFYRLPVIVNYGYMPPDKSL